MLKQMLTAASLAVLLAGSAHAAPEPKRGKIDLEREPVPLVRKKAPPPDVKRHPPQVARAHAGDRDGRDHHDDGRPVRDWRDNDWRDPTGRDHDGRDHDWRDRDDNHDGRNHGWRDDDRNHDWRDRDWRRDDDWRRRGWRYQGWRNDGWRYYRGNDNRHWRYVPPYRFTLDRGYRSGYELAWRDWLAYGRYNRYWRRPGLGYGASVGYGSGYEAGWRDAAMYYGRGYRPDYWAYDPQGGWYFSFRIEG
jgi:hypothetical protein